MPIELRSRRLLVLSATVLAAAISLWTASASAQGTSYAFVDVNVVDMDAAEILASRTVVVTGDRITTMGEAPDVAIPASATVIDGSGRYLMPGLAEMHGHVPGNDEPAYLADVLFLYIANGVTTVRGMQGQPGHLELRAALANHKIIGPRFIASGPGLNGDRVDGPASARRLVLDQAATGYDFVKVLRGLTREEYDAAVDAAAEAGTTLAGHVSDDVGVARTLEARQATIDHLDGYLQYLVPPEVDLSGRSAGFYGINLLDLVDETRIAPVAAETRDAGVWIVPTQALVEHIAMPSPTTEEQAASPAMAYVPPRVIEEWIAAKQRMSAGIGDIPDGGRRLQDLRARLIEAMHDAGVQLLLGSDAPQVFSVPGFSLHQELALIVDAGLTPYEALRTGTIAPAEFLGLEEEFGRIREGLAADLVLLAADPLADVTAASRPLGVMSRGRWLDRDAIDQGLTAIASRHR